MKIFWLDDPEILVTEYKEILPTKSQSTQQQLNALTRLILVVTLILLIIQFDMWYFFFLFAIILVLILAVIIIEVENSENYSDQDKMNASQTKQKPVKSKKLNPSLSSNTSPVHIYDDLPETTSVFSDTFVNSSAQHGNSAAFDAPRHGGSVGYLSADQSGLSSEQNVEDAKNDAIENHYFRENIRREKISRRLFT